MLQESPGVLTPQVYAPCEAWLDPHVLVPAGGMDSLSHQGGFLEVSMISLEFLLSNNQSKGQLELS